MIFLKYYLKKLIIHRNFISGINLMVDSSKFNEKINMVAFVLVGVNYLIVMISKECVNMKKKIYMNFLIIFSKINF